MPDIHKPTQYDWEPAAWKILKEMLNSPGFLIQHQIGHFNDFLDRGLSNVIEQFNPIVLNYDFIQDQQFFRFKDDSAYNKPDSDWVEYRELSDIHKIFKDNYSIVNNQISTIDLSEQLTSSNDKEELLQTEFHEFVQEHLEFKTIEVNKHRYDLEISIFFNSITPPVIYENNGSQKVMYPNEARARNFTYASNTFVDFHFKTRERCGEAFCNIKEHPVTIIQKVTCGKLPIMLGSKACILSTKTYNKRIDYEECEYDEGGYFIVNGTEKVLVCQERQAENKIYVFQNSKTQSKYSHICEIKSLPDKKVLTPKNVQVKITAKESIHGRNIKVSIPHIKQDVPLYVVFKALNITNDFDITNYILYDVPRENWREYTQFLRASLEEASTITTQEMAKEYLCKHVNMMGYDRDKSEKERRMTYLNDIITNDFLPHLGNNSNIKCYFLGYMVKHLLDVFLNKKEVDDRDSYVNKRIDTSGVLMSNLFRQYYTKLIKDMKTNINKEYTNGSWKATREFNNIINDTNIYKCIKFSTITTGLKFALATGNWGLKNNKNKQGIAQVLSRLTYNSSISHLRRVNTPMEKTSKLVAPRKLHGTQIFYICGAETPEGAGVGVVKNLALSCHVTGYSDIAPIYDLISGFNVIPIKDVSPSDIPSSTKIFINGSWHYITYKPKKIIDELRNMRRCGLIHIHTAVVWKIREHMIEIYTDAGRCTRPIYITKNSETVISNKVIKQLEDRKINWNNLISGSLNSADTTDQTNISEGVIEFIDVQEEDNCMIAINHEQLVANKTRPIKCPFTHCEIHPAFIQGILASMIPFSDHNQSPRNTYQSAMGKQAMGIYATNYRYRMDTLAHILRYPQLPLVSSRVIKYLPSNNLPSGINAIVAIASYSGYNQEDSIIMNKSSIERGLFISDYFRTYKDEEKKRQSSSVKMQEKFTRPNMKNTLGTQGNNYSKLNDKGFPNDNVYVKENDVIIGKIHPIHSKKDTNELYRCCSSSIKGAEAGFVDKVMVNRNGDGYKFVKVRIRTVRVPTVGDKHASRHGQKGTVGMVYKQEDMPFNKLGMKPDLIMNPHAVPSRMTIAQVIECLMGKIGTNIGMYGDATAFTKFNEKKLGDILEDLGFHRHCDEVLYNGRTGEQLKVNIFMGPTFYQRLKHMVDDKIHSRSNGPNVILTRQPVEGRSRDGGLRFGEMERDCILSHGAAQFLKETLQDRSDNYRMYTCKFCGLVSSVNKAAQINYCKNCDNNTSFSEVRVPYAMKLFIQELETMCVAPRLNTKKY
jgi:DNA-directed RNA polymerase II subunit RPB2